MYIFSCFFSSSI